MVRGLRGSLVALVVIAGVVSCGDDQEPPGTAQAPPAAITTVFPPAGSAGPSPTHVSVGFDAQRDGGVDLESVRVLLDGRDVTGRARRAGSDDVPQSRAELIYEIERPLPEGGHRVEVEYRGGGKTYRYAWEFTVRT